MHDRPSPLQRLPFNLIAWPMQAAFAGAQQMYRAGLLAAVNLRRGMAGKAPVEWPSTGQTPTEVVWSEGAARLLRFRRTSPGSPASTGGTDSVDAHASKPAVLLVCSLINRPYILDLLPERSVVGGLLDAGLDVWLLDWGHPRPEDERLGLAHYALGALPRAARAVAAAVGAPPHVLGYCMGGTFALMALAAGQLEAQSLVAMATPVDFHDTGLLSQWCRAPGFDPAELAAAHGNLPPYILQPAFKALDPVGLASKFVHLDAKIGDDDFLRFFFAMEGWLEDSVAFPGRAFEEWVALYRENALARGALAIDDQPIDLRRVVCPILNIVAERDYITPGPSSLALGALVGSRDYELVQMSGGHIGLSTGGAAHKHLWPKVAAWLHARTAAAPAGSAAPRTAGAGAQRPSKSAAAAVGASGHVAPPAKPHGRAPVAAKAPRARKEPGVAATRTPRARKKPSVAAASPPRAPSRSRR